MIKSLRYSRGVVRKSSALSNIGVGEKIWIDLFNPTESEIKRVSKISGVHATDLKKVLDRDELPRTVNRKDYSMIILRALDTRKGYTPFGIFLSNNFIISVHSKKVGTIDELFELLKGDEGKEFFSNGLTYIFCRISSYVTKRFHNELDKLEDEIDKLEDQILENKVKNPKKIFNLKKKITNIRRALITNQDLIEVISMGHAKYINVKNINWFSELKMENNQTVSISEISRERLTGTMDMYMSSVSNRLNDIMKSFTIIASLLLLPMLITGIWGMNFENIPFYYYGNGFYIPLLIMFISVALMGFYFKRKKWM
tara:strand:+ start:4452 stop:5390 length:939 start_codon:yes stop_codon:yes gene_type:complete